MKEMYAYQNDDGTYRVEIVNTIEEIVARNGSKYVETTTSEIIIDKAEIHITALNMLSDDAEMYTIIV